MGMAEPLGDQVVRRALEVERMGQYIGAFELVVWSALRNVRVGLVVGGSVHDLRQVFMPELPAPPSGLSAGTHYLIACNLGERGQLHPVDTHALVPVFRHYVSGVPLPDRDSSKSIDPVSGSDNLRGVCLRLGFGVVETQCAGDCGIDALCHQQGRPRASGEFKRVRCELAAFMKAHAEDAAWQACFCACGESKMNPSKPPSGPAPSSTSTGAASTSSSSKRPPSGKSASALSKRARLAAWFKKPYDLKQSKEKRWLLGADRSVPKPKDSSKSGDSSLAQKCLFGSEFSGPKSRDSSKSEEPPEPGPPPEAPPPLPPPLEDPPQQDKPGPSLPETAIVLWRPAAEAVGVSTQCALTSRRGASVRQWLQSLPPTELAAITQDYGTFLAARDEWLSSLCPAEPSSGKKKNRNLQRLTKLDHRIALGLEYLAWSGSQSTLDSSKFQLAAFCKHKWGLVPVTKARKMWVTRCIKAAQAVADQSQPWKVGPSLQQQSKNKKICLRQFRLRQFGLQGRPVMAPMLREGLFDWFCSIRASVLTRIPPKLVLLQAKAIASAMLHEMRRTGMFVSLPVLDKHWLQRWKHSCGVSLRKPTKRYKVKRSVMRGRLRAMWVTNVRVRALAKFTLGIDLPIYGFDQKGIYMNENGAKNVGVLALDGCEEVPLKENHAATRSRVSLMTSVVSTQSEVDALEHGLPLEIMFKGKTDFILRRLEAPDSSNVSTPQWLRLVRALSI